MHICLLNLSKYEVSLFHLYIAFYVILITASSSYNKNNEYDMSETSLRNQTTCTVRNQIDFVKIST